MAGRETHTKRGRLLVLRLRSHKVAANEEDERKNREVPLFGRLVAKVHPSGIIHCLRTGHN